MRLGSVDRTGRSRRRPACARERAPIDPDYSTRGGYDAEFLRHAAAPSAARDTVGRVPGVALSPLQRRDAPRAGDGAVHRRQHRRNGSRRARAATATDGFSTRDFAADQQTGEDVYRDNPLDRGHLVRRLDPAWGPLAKAANDDTFHFTNCTPQHHDFNAGQTLWLGPRGLRAEERGQRRSRTSASSPDRYSRPTTAVPRGGAAASVLEDGGDGQQDGGLSVTGYLLSQDALLDEFADGGRRRSPTARTARSRCPCGGSPQLTGLVLAPYIAADPLERIEASSPPRELIRPQDLIL